MCRVLTSTLVQQGARATFTWGTRCVGYLHTNSEWFAFSEPSRTTPLGDLHQDVNCGGMLKKELDQYQIAVKSQYDCYCSLQGKVEWH